MKIRKELLFIDIFCVHNDGDGINFRTKNLTVRRRNEPNLNGMELTEQNEKIRGVDRKS